MSAWDVVRGQFEDPHARAFMLWMSLMTVQPPERPGTGLLTYSLTYGRQENSWVLPRGGSAALPLALAAADRGTRGHDPHRPACDAASSSRRAAARASRRRTASASSREAPSSPPSTPKQLVELAPAQAWAEEFVHAVDAVAGRHQPLSRRTWPPPRRRRTRPRAALSPRSPRERAASVDRLLRLGSDAERGLLAAGRARPARRLRAPSPIPLGPPRASTC